MARTEHVQYLVMVPNYWGIGDTIEDAVEEMIAAGGYISSGYTLYSFPPDTIFQSVHPVFGEITFSSRDGESKPSNPSETTVSRRAAILHRVGMINTALFADDIDADIREDLREERQALRDDLATLGA